MQETEFDSWVRMIPLEKEVATDSSILAWRIPRTEDPGGLQSMRYPRMYLVLGASFSPICLPEAAL